MSFIYKPAVDQFYSYIKKTSRQGFQQNANQCGADKKSAIFDYLFSCTHCQSSDIVQNFKVLKPFKKIGTLQPGINI